MGSGLWKNKLKEHEFKGTEKIQCQHTTGQWNLSTLCQQETEVHRLPKKTNTNSRVEYDVPNKSWNHPIHF